MDVLNIISICLSIIISVAGAAAYVVRTLKAWIKKEIQEQVSAAIAAVGCQNVQEKHEELLTLLVRSDLALAEVLIRQDDNGEIAKAKSEILNFITNLKEVSAL